MLKVKFLGTSAMVPTVRRNNSSIYLNYLGDHILLDCAEGTQRQMQIAEISPTKINMLLISHWHGDHVLGIPGLLQTLAANNYQRTLKIFGPKGTRQWMNKMFNLSISQDHELNIEIKEVNKGLFFENDDYELHAQPLDHQTKCLGFSLIEKNKRKINLSYVSKFGLKRHPLLGRLQKGKDVSYKGKKISAKKATTIIEGKKATFILDTAYFAALAKFAKNSELLVCESTMADELEQRAKQFKHLTPSQAATIAKKAKVKKLILTHFSQRYKSSTVFKNQARRIFKNTICASDFLDCSW